MALYIGVDAGGTKINAALTDSSLKIIRKTTIPTEPKKGRKHAIKNIINAIKEVETGKPKATGIGMPGYTDSKGRQQITPNIPQFTNYPLKKELEKRLGRKITMKNDAHCFMLAESRAGAAKGMKNAIGLTLGTGIGGGAITEGKLLQGKNGGAAHFGHTIIERGKTLEGLCGGKNLEKKHYELAGRKMTAQQIFQSKGKKQKEIVTDYYKNLATGVVSLINAFNPEAVILGGGIGLSIELKRLQKEIRKQANTPLIKEAKILKSKLGSKAGVIGAAILAMENYIEKINTPEKAFGSLKGWKIDAQKAKDELRMRNS